VRKIRKILAALLLLSASGLLGETREFEFELADIFYPLLSEEQTLELKNEMIKGIEVNAYYKGDVKATIAKYTWLERHFPQRRQSQEVVYTTWQDDWKPVKITRLKNGKISFKAPMEIKFFQDKIVDSTEYEGVIPLINFRITMPIGKIFEMLNTTLHNDDVMRIQTIGVGKDFEEKYVYDSDEPIRNSANVEVGKALSNDVDMYSMGLGAKLITLSKLSMSRSSTNKSEVLDNAKYVKDSLSPLSQY
jgi:hypothetical protein